MRNFLIYYCLFVFRANPKRSNDYIVRHSAHPERIAATYNIDTISENILSMKKPQQNLLHCG